MKTMTRLLLAICLATGTAWADAEGHAADVGSANSESRVTFIHLTTDPSSDRSADWSTNGDIVQLQGVVAWLARGGFSPRLALAVTPQPSLISAYQVPSSD